MGWAERVNPKALQNLSLPEQAKALAKKDRERKARQDRTEKIGKLRRMLSLRATIAREKKKDSEPPVPEVSG